MTDDEADLVVVGAGPTGSAAALRARQLAPGARVLLLDRATFPRDKPCGDGIGPDGVDVLRLLGVADEVLAGYPAIRRIAVRSPSGVTARGVAPRGGHVVPRRVLDARLRQAALDRGVRGVTHRVRRVEQRRDHVVVDGQIRARWVLAADGANSTVRRLVGAAPQPREHTGLAMRGYAHWPELDALTIRFEPRRWPAYAWAFPVDGRGLVNVGYGPFDATTVARRRDLVDGLRAALPHVDVRAETLRAHHLPLSTARPAPTHGRVLLAGDAASLVHPMTGEGIYYGLLSGVIAGAAVARFPADAARVYRAGLRHRLGRHLRHTGVAARLFRWQLPVDASVAVAAQRPDVLEELCEFALATGVITPRMVRSLTRHAIRHRAAVPRSSVPPGTSA